MKRKLMFAVLLVALTGGAGFAWANGTYTTIKVMFSKITIMLNGTPFSQNRDVMLYNGEVYVPLDSLTEMLGAQMRWSSNQSAISIDFTQDDRDVVFSAAQRGLYQYISIEKRAITDLMSKQLAARNWSGLQEPIDRLEKLRSLASQIPDKEMATALEKMKTSAEWIRNSYSSNKISQSKLAWVLFGQNLDKLNQIIRTRMDENSRNAQREMTDTSAN